MAEELKDGAVFWGQYRPDVSVGDEVVIWRADRHAFQFPNGGQAPASQVQLICRIPSPDELRELTDLMTAIVSGDRHHDEDYGITQSAERALAILQRKAAP